MYYVEKEKYEYYNIDDGLVFPNVEKCLRIGIFLQA
jgi:hypothetical protein